MTHYDKNQVKGMMKLLSQRYQKDAVTSFLIKSLVIEMARCENTNFLADD